MMIITAGISWLSLMVVLATLPAEQPHSIVSFHEVLVLIAYANRTCLGEFA